MTDRLTISEFRSLRGLSTRTGANLGEAALAAVEAGKVKGDGENAQPAAKARKRAVSPKPPTEHEEQVELFRWAEQNASRIPALRFLFAIPNGAKLPYKRTRKGKRFSSEALKLLASGLKPGVPDVMLAAPSGGLGGLFIEMKRAKKSLSVTSPEQRAWIDGLTANNYRAEICYGAEAAKVVILDYLGVRL